MIYSMIYLITLILYSIFTFYILYNIEGENSMVLGATNSVIGFIGIYIFKFFIYDYFKNITPNWFYYAFLALIFIYPTLSIIHTIKCLICKMNKNNEQ